MYNEKNECRINLVFFKNRCFISFYFHFIWLIDESWISNIATWQNKRTNNKSYNRSKVYIVIVHCLHTLDTYSTSFQRERDANSILLGQLAGTTWGGDVPCSGYTTILCFCYPGFHSGLSLWWHVIVVGSWRQSCY